MIPDERMWAIGLFEGEGNIYIARASPKQRMWRPGIRLAVRMTDLDVLERFHRIVQVGTIRAETHKRNPKWKQPFLWRAAGRDAENLLRNFLPELGERRRLKALEALETCVPGENSDHLRIEFEETPAYPKVIHAFDTWSRRVG